MSTEEPQVGRPPGQVRAAGALVVGQGLLGVGTAVLLLAAAASVGAVTSATMGGAGYFLAVGGALLAVGTGLIRGRRWARTPAIVTQLLLLPVVYSLLGPSRQLVLGMVAGAVVVTAFLLLISEPSRVWSMGLEDRS